MEVQEFGDELTQEEYEALKKAYKSRSATRAPEVKDEYTQDEFEALKVAKAQENQQYTPLESAGKGALRGATLGASPMIEGGLDTAIDAGMDAWNEKRLPAGKELIDKYRMYRDKALAKDNRAADANPKSYMAGSLAGAFGSTALPGLGFLNAPKGASLATQAGKAVTTGAIQGFNYGNADLTKNQWKESIDDSMAGAAMGGLGLGVSRAIGSSAKSVGEVIPKIASTLGSIAYNLPPEVLKRYIGSKMGGKDLMKGPSEYEVARGVTKDMDALGDLAKWGSEDARALLRREGIFYDGSMVSRIAKTIADREEARLEGAKTDSRRLAAINFLRHIEKEYAPTPVMHGNPQNAGKAGSNTAAENLQAKTKTDPIGSVYGDDQPRAPRKVEEAMRDNYGIDPYKPVSQKGETVVGGGTKTTPVPPREAVVPPGYGQALDDNGRPKFEEKKVSTNRIKDEIQSLDNQVEWDYGPGGKAPIDDRIRKELRSELDGTLKYDSPAYEKEMRKVAQYTDLLTRMRDIIPSDNSAINVYRRAIKDKYGRGQLPMETLTEFDDLMGTNHLDAAANAVAKTMISQPKGMGSRAVNLGKAVLGPIIGKPAAAVVGGAMDTMATPFVKGTITAAAKLSSLLKGEGREAFHKSLAPLFDAASAGNKEAALTLYLLKRKHPEEFPSGGDE